MPTRRVMERRLDDDVQEVETWDSVAGNVAVPDGERHASTIVL